VSIFRKFIVPSRDAKTIAGIVVTHFRRVSNKPLGANRVDSSKVAALAQVEDDPAERFFSETH
jgi:hypothetical protein